MIRVRELLKFSFLFLLSVLIFNSVIFSQSIPFGKISVEEGLSNSFVNCLLQDRTGFVWFGTDDGLNRFDGYEVKVYRNDPSDNSSISENIIWALWEDHSGNLWIGTKSGGLDKYDPLTNKFEHWEIDSASPEEINITYIYEDSKSNIWIGTYHNGLYRFNPSKNKFEHWQNTIGNPKLLSDNFITSIIEDQNSNIWIATYAGLDKFIPQQTDRPFKKIFSDFKNPIWYVTKSSFIENTIWMGAFNGLFNFDPVNEKLSQINLPEKDVLQFGNSVSSIAEEYFLSEKILWIGTFGGLVQINLSTGHEKRFLQTKKGDSEIVSNQIHDLIIDRSGVLWIATENGLNFNSQKRSKFNLVASGNPLSEILPQLSGKNVRAVTETSDKSLWFGTDAGLLGLQSKTGHSSIVQNPELLSINAWSLLSGSSERLWIGTYGQGLKDLNLKTNKLKSWKVDNPNYNVSAFGYVKTIIEDDDEMIWLGFWGGGLAKLNPINSNVVHWRNEKDNPSSLSHNDIWVLQKDSKGRIWIGTNGGGLNLYNPEMPNSFYCWNSSNKNKQTISSNSIYTICESVSDSKPDNQTVLWIGTASGLNKFIIINDSGSSDGSKLDVEIKHYTVENGLPDNAIESILEDESGNLWIGTSSGISFFSVDEESFTNYTTADGLNGSSFNSSAAFKTADGIMMIGCTTGLNYFDSRRIKQSAYSPLVVITDFQILNQPADEKNISMIHSNNFNSKEIVLSYNQNDFSFQFASLDFNAPALIQYAYYMEGFDREWIYSGKRRFVTYTNLDPGEYVFQVKATNSDGLWNEKAAKIFIVINPPFWATWWFRTFMILCLLSVGPFIYYRRVTALQKEKRIQVEFSKQLIRSQEEDRKRIASELHDSLGQDLLVIKNLALMNKDKNEHFDEISRTTSFAIDDVRRIAYNLHPYQFDRLGLTKAIGSMFINIEGLSEIKFDNEIENVDGIFEKEKEINIYRIIQEGVNNIIKHSGADKARIKVQKLEGSVIVEIADNGKGFILEIVRSESKGFGLKNLENRVSFLGGEIQFTSDNEFATIVKIKIPIGVHGKD